MMRALITGGSGGIGRGRQIPAGRLGQPADVVTAVRHLASQDAGYVTGQVLHVNGGWWFGT